MKNIFINNHEIGNNNTFIIAEIGSNHNQSLEYAFKSIDAAIDSGADAVKFQSINIKELYYCPSDSTKELHKKIDMQEEWHSTLSEYCIKKGITFFSAPTYLSAIDILESINVPLYKLASAQIGTFPQLVEKVAATGKPVILSAGIVTKKELRQVVEIFKRNNNEQLIILHCNSIYPTPYNKVHLDIMIQYKNEFNCQVGFSDHTPDIFVPIAAVAMGAQVIEKHFALDKSLPVPDAPFSLDPIEFKKMVAGIRAIEQTLIPDSRNKLKEEEYQFKESIIYRLVAKKDLTLGQEIKVDDFSFLRYHQGIDCRDLNHYIDIQAVYRQNIEKGKILDIKDIIFS